MVMSQTVKKLTECTFQPKIYNNYEERNMNPKGGVHIPHDERYIQKATLSRSLDIPILKVGKLTF